jgi:DNA-binding transcriptional regulator YdaS (Cro superfamily)
MLTSHAIAHFGNKAALARTLGISRTAVSRWKKIVPELSAHRLQLITKGKLVVKPELYKKDNLAA